MSSLNGKTDILDYKILCVGGEFHNFYAFLLDFNEKNEKFINRR